MRRRENTILHPIIGTIERENLFGINSIQPYLVKVNKKQKNLKIKVL